LHVSQALPAGLWVIEPRHATVAVDDELTLPDGSYARLLAPYPASHRLWVARFEHAVPDLMARDGRPITYPYVFEPWPHSMYQAVYAGPAGSAEMPSAGRAFTPDVLET